MKASDDKSPTETDESLKKLSTDECEFNLNRLRFGLTQDARLFLRQCVLYLEMGDALPFPYAVFLAERLNEIASAEDPWSAKLLKRGIGQKGGDQLDRNFDVAKDVWNEIQKGRSVESAANKVADRSTKRAEEQLVRPTKKISVVSGPRAKTLYKKYRAVLAREDPQSDVAKAAMREPPISPEFLAMFESDAGKGTIDSGVLRAIQRHWMKGKPDEAGLILLIKLITSASWPPPKGD